MASATFNALGKMSSTMISMIIANRCRQVFNSYTATIQPPSEAVSCGSSSMHMLAMYSMHDGQKRGSFRLKELEVDRRRDRTCNLLIRSQAPCHWASRPMIVEEEHQKRYLYHGVGENSVLQKVAPAEIRRSRPGSAQCRPCFRHSFGKHHQETA
jgi:hypothetical protein